MRNVRASPEAGMAMGAKKCDVEWDTSHRLLRTGKDQDRFPQHYLRGIRSRRTHARKPIGSPIARLFQPNPGESRVPPDGLEAFPSHDFRTHLVALAQLCGPCCIRLYLEKKTDFQSRQITPRVNSYNNKRHAHRKTNIIHSNSKQTGSGSTHCIWEADGEMRQCI